MDYMDIDQVFDVPDTPDRLATQNINGRGFMEKERDSSVGSHSRNNYVFSGGARNQPTGRSKLVMDNGHIRRLPVHPFQQLGVSEKSECKGDFTVPSGNSSSSKNAHLFRRTVADKTAIHEKKNSCKEKGKAMYPSQSSAFRGNEVVDLTEQSGPVQELQKPFLDRASECHHAKEIRKGPISANGSTLQGIANSSTISHKSYKGKEKLDDTCKRGPGIDHGKGIFGDSLSKAGKSTSSSFVSIPSPTVRGQKRLVRNGVISPQSIANAKPKQFAEKPSHGSADVQNDKAAPASNWSSNMIRELIAEDNNSHRRKGGISHIFSSREPDTKTVNLSTRDSITQNEEASGTSIPNGWQTTRNRTKLVNLPSSDRGQHFSRVTDDPFFVNQQTDNSGVRRDIGNGVSTRLGYNCHDGSNEVPFPHGSASAVSHVSKSDQVNGHFTAASTLIKRQKQGSASNNRVETSTSASVDPERVFLGSLGEPSNSRSTRNKSNPGILDPVIEIDEFSPERSRGSHNMGCSRNSDSVVRARQLEADEMLARELQEQLYNEAPGVGDGEIDAHIALALQQEETSQHSFTSGSHVVFHPRGLVIPNFSGQSQARSSQYPSSRRGNQVRGRSTTRLTRLRSRLPSQSTRISHRGRSPIFPPDMDLDMRMHILEALEAFNEMGVTGNFLQAADEFNANDYETLLALDENNHQHAGASLDQINRLPQSTVQGDNFDETCAICLDTPTTGDAIRHLPCLHKFHKDCIDPWLRRKTSCPVCKCSIT